MLARPERYRCIECDLPYGNPLFALYEGKPENGPAYWSDRGLLCSPRCSVAHYERRRAEGTLPVKPAPNPFDL